MNAYPSFANRAARPAIAGVARRLHEPAILSHVAAMARSSQEAPHQAAQQSIAEAQARKDQK